MNLLTKSGLPLLMMVCAPASADQIVFDDSESGNWVIVNDTVMGGVSSSRFYRYDRFAVFEGVLSLDNNGGFASVRRTKSPEFSTDGVIRIRVLGDGRKYQFRLKTPYLYWGASYVAEFQTQRGQWQEVEFAEQDFTAKFRGRLVSGAPVLRFADAVQLGFLIGDKREGPFRLGIEYIQGLEKI